MQRKPNVIIQKLRIREEKKEFVKILGIDKILAHALIFDKKLF